MSFDMGQYGIYIWPAYAISALALGGMTLWAVIARRRAMATLARLEPRAAQPRQENQV